MITHLHHINFLVNDIDIAIKRYEAVLGEGVFQRDDLTQRAVTTARVKLGETWLILVQPLDDQSLPAKHLAKHGEGFFMLSLGTDDLAAEQHAISNHPDFTDPPFVTPQREGLDGWQVLDFQMQHFFGAQLQLTEDVST